MKISVKFKDMIQLFKRIYLLLFVWNRIAYKNA